MENQYLTNWKIIKYLKYEVFGKLADFTNCYNWIIWKMVKYSKLLNLKNQRIFKILQFGKFEKKS